MNSRSSVNESNLVNLSGDLSALNQLESKESLALSFPFDHLYACHSESSDRQQTHVDKELELTPIVDDKDLLSTSNASFEVSRLSERLTAAENQNKRLKNLLIYHLDLIQQQNELITKKDKQNTALKLENDSLKSKVTRMDKRTTVGQRHNINPAPPVSAPISSIPSIPTIPATVKTEPGTSDTQLMFNSYNDFLMPEPRTNPYIFNNDLNTKPYSTDPFDLNKTSETDVSTFLPGDLGTSSILDSSLSCDNFNTMIDNKRSFVSKKDIKTEPRHEPLYTVTANSGNTVIQKIQRNRRRTSGGIGSLSRLPKTSAVKNEPPESGNLFDDDKAFERSFSVNKKSKMINTYGKSKTSTLPKKTPHYTGSLSDRLQLIDTTPTGEDPYQLGEADMREQSPIPKLMLQKTNHGRMKICSDLMGESTIPPRRTTIYDAPSTDTSSKMPNKIRLEKRYNLPNISPYVPPPTTRTSTQTSSASTHTATHSTYTSTRTTSHGSSKTTNKASHTSLHKASHAKTSHSRSSHAKTLNASKVSHTAVSPVIKKEKITSPTHNSPQTQPSNLEPKRDPDLDWRIYSPNSTPTRNETSLCDFSYGETLPSLDVSEFRQLLQAETEPPANIFELDTLEYISPKNDKIKRRGARTTSLMATGVEEEGCPDSKRGLESKRGRKRALSTAGLIKNVKQNLPKPVGAKPRTVKGKGACRGKKSPVPGLMTRKPYHTHVGDPDLSWYYGLDPDVKMEDIDQTGDCKASTVEVPRWREKPYTSCYTLEGTENLDDKVFEKRHQKLEAEERRQLRWHMRRIREQRHVERLRMRQRDPWYSNNSYQPSVYTIWPQPQRDLRLIEITDTIPVMAFGEELPDLPPSDFMLPWVRTSKALKRSKRSKTLH